MSAVPQVLRQPLTLTVQLAAAAGPSPRPATAVMIIGMHRSGTSALTRIVNHLGPTLAREEDLVGPLPSNLNGQWESMSMTGFQEALLRRRGGSWDDPPDLPVGWARKRSLILEVGRARRLVRHVFGDAPVWAWKDPRTSLTLPFWRRVLPRHTLIPVVIHRHPLEVAESLASRDGFPQERALGLWEIYNRALLRDLEGMPALHLSYAQLVSDPTATAVRLRHFLVAHGVAIAHAPDETVRSLVDVSLRHHTIGDGPSGEYDGMTPGQRELYESLQSLAQSTHDSLSPLTRE